MEVTHSLPVQLEKWKEELLDEKIQCKSICKHPGFLLAVLDKISDSDCVQKVTVGLSKLVWKFPVAARFAEDYFTKHGSPFNTVSDKLQARQAQEPQPKRRKTARIKQSANGIDSTELLKASLIIMRKLPTKVFSNWSVDSFLSLKDNTKTVGWLAVQCLRLILSLSDMEVSILLEKYQLSEYDNSCQTVQFENEMLDVLILETPVSNVVSEYFSAHEITQVAPNMDLLSVGGIIVKSEKPLDPSQQQAFESLNIVPLPSVLDYVKKILLQIQRGNPVCVAGPIGVGKSSLILFTASVCGRNQFPDVISVQMSDQIDSRLLLGSYHSTDLPGQFVWKPGCLTNAILNGHWIVFEDLDSAPADVVTLLDAIADTKRVEVPGYGLINEFHANFRMFATVRTTNSGFGKDFDKRCKSWTNLTIEGFSSDELCIVIGMLFPFLNSNVDRIVEIFESVKNASLVNKRSISVRDLIKFCCRLPKELDFTTTNAAIVIFQEACDIFVSPLRTLGEKMVLAEVIGTHLNLLKTKVEYFMTMTKPHINICCNTSTFVAGRFDLQMFQQLPTTREDIGTYSLTKRACLLLEMISGAVKNKEPVLLIGETGVGKTSSIQYLAKVLHQKLIVVNLNRQSDSSDVLGGYKPVELKHIFSPLREEFEVLFASSFDRESNSKFLTHIMTCFANRRWLDLLKLMGHVQKKAIAKESLCSAIAERWGKLGNQIARIESQLNDGSESPFAFAFIEGTLMDAVRKGYWILLDEINLATSEMLQCFSGVLDRSSQIHLWEKGDEEPVQRHPNFHLFAAMNPSTDVGKKDLPIGIRNRFTEFFVDDLMDQDELRVLVSDYLMELSLPSEQISEIVGFYLQIKRLSSTVLIDGMGKRPHFSLRTLCRALKISSYNLYGSVRRSLYESFCLSFLTQLDYSSHPVVQQLIAKFICGKSELKALLRQPIPQPTNQNVVMVEGYWLPKGNKEPKSPEKYILTASVRRNLQDIARVVSAGKLPVLIQGETSVGKTSLIQYLADTTGNTCYRINNHQHTDLQEYVGSYQSDSNGKLVFTEGVLVQAMRRGEWIILDELNLAPSEVLEALNRLLDDNRQLFITETGVTVTAHPRFMLFATQNPPGLYGGRKLLSRAFRNRFVELHFDEIPTNELETILHLRCDIPQSYCKKIIGVLKELQARRKSSAVLQGKHSFATLRDLFRWAERYRLSGQQKSKFYDWDQHLADEGYLVLAGKSRQSAEADVVREVLQKHLKRRVDSNNLFSLHENTSAVTRDILELVLKNTVPEFKHIVWTYPMRRLAVLIGCCMKFKEPILLVGETGAGKTSVVQLLAEIYGRKLYTVNCHMHSESSDFLGGLRPVRNTDEKESKLFEWVDGPLVEAMEKGDVFLADEISLADDSVLERLNSVLEPERTLLVAEKGDESPKLVIADDSFHFIGTMNPGGDFGKKELSPALRNRLTEIWCESTTQYDDLIQIIEHNLSKELKGKEIATVMIQFVQWLKNNNFGKRCTVSIRDYLSWVAFVNYTTAIQREKNQLQIAVAMEHGSCLSFLDGLGVGDTATENVSATRSVRELALTFLRTLMETHMEEESTQILIPKYEISESEIQLGPFVLQRNSLAKTSLEYKSFTIESPTTRVNALRIFRALQLNKPILLEGSPGQGKTALVTALAKVAGYPITRINLSEQTDISDLFGADLPVEGKEGGHFSWRDGPLLQALKSQAWILLDELNLASQSVLEGLNACLDHRGEIYVPELNRTFKLHGGKTVQPTTRIFACQNPLRQGGARKGLPKSFLNRFAQVYVESLNCDDMKFILQSQYTSLDKNSIELMTTFATTLFEAVCIKREFGRRGSPWDFNLRDLMRWAELACEDYQKGKSATKQLHPELFVDLIYGMRMRSSEDRKCVLQLFYDLWCKNEHGSYKNPGVLEWGGSEVLILDNVLRCGRAEMSKNNENEENSRSCEKLILVQQHFAPAEATIACLSMGWMPILVGSRGTGKTSLVKLLANICGKRLEIVNPSPEMDTIELLGGFEQADIYRKIDEACVDVCDLLRRFVKKAILLSADFVQSLEQRLETSHHHHRRRHRISNATEEKADVSSSTHSTQRQTQSGLDWQLVDLWKIIKTLPHLTPDGSLGHAEEIKRIEKRVDFLKKAYLRCKSFFEIQLLAGGVGGLELEDEVEASTAAAGSSTHADDLRKVAYNENNTKGNGTEEENNAKAEIKGMAAAAAKQHLRRVAREIEQIYTHLKAGIQTGSFQWIDSVLIKALVEGKWLLIDGANRCSAAVLDRLNSLMEPNGSLLLSERGSLDGKIVEIKPHPDFRLILSMDPTFGEISRAMRNRGVEIFMSNSSGLLKGEKEKQLHSRDENDTPMEVDISEEELVADKNSEDIAEVTPSSSTWKTANVCPTFQSEFGITVFDVEALQKAQGLSNPRLRGVILNLHREIHQAVAFFSSSSATGSADGIESKLSKMISIWRQITLEMENGEGYKEAIWNSFSAALKESDDILLILNADKKAVIQEIITRYCQGLADDAVVNLKEKPLPIRTLADCGSSQAYRIFKKIEVISNALSCETSWSQYESWRLLSQQNKKLVEDFLITTVFSTTVQTDIRGLLLAFNKRYPLKSSFATRLTAVLESALSSGSERGIDGIEGLFLSAQGDIQRDGHLMSKLCDENKEEQINLLASQMKLSLRLVWDWEIFSSKQASITSSGETVKKKTLGFVAGNMKRTESGNLQEFLYGFWQIVTTYEKLFDRCITERNGTVRRKQDESFENLVTDYARVWAKGMIAIFWRKRMGDLLQEEFNIKRPSEKLKSNIALLVQWIGDQVVPTLDAIRGIDNSKEGKELAALVGKCLEPLDPCGNRNLLQRSKSFRSFYSIRPFLPSDSLDTVNNTLSLCLKLWVANAPVDIPEIQQMLMLCSNGNGSEASHRALSEICKKVLKMEVASVNLDEANFVTNLHAKLEELQNRRDISVDDLSTEHNAVDKMVRRCEKVVDSVQDFLRLLDISSTHLKYSVFVSPLVEALSSTKNSNKNDETNVHEFFYQLLLWEDKERFRKYYTECPPSTVLQSCCLLPYFTSKVILDDDSHLIRSASLGSRDRLVSHYKTLNRQLSCELTRPRKDWESTPGLLNSTREFFSKLASKWTDLFLLDNDEDGLLKMTTWRENMESLFLKAENGHASMDEILAEVGCYMVEISCFVMECASYLPVVDPSVESEFAAKYLVDEIDYFSSWSTAQRLFSLYTVGHDIRNNGNKTDFRHVHPYVHEVFRLLESSSEKVKEAQSNIAARPDPPEYEAMRREAVQFVRTMASKTKIDDLTTRVRNLFKGNDVLPTESEMNAVLIPCSSWIESCSNFVHKQLRRFWYWDINLAYLHPAIQTITGFSYICEAIRRTRVNVNLHEKLKILKMLDFPSQHTSQVSDASGIYEEAWAYKRATKKLLLSSLWNFYNKVISYDCVTPGLMNELHGFSIEIGRLLNEQQEEKQRQKELENAMYVYRGKEKTIEGSAEEEEMKYMGNLFPDFSNDFQDLVESNSFADSAEKPSSNLESTSSNDVDILDSDDVDFFMKVHSLALSHIRNHCLKAGQVDKRHDFLTPFVNRFEIACYAFQNSYLNYSKDDEESILIASTVMMARLDSNVNDGVGVGDGNEELYDVYRDANTAEVVRLGPVLSAFRKRIEQLLAEWPDHPALLRIVELIDRIESFDVKSSLVKFLTGLEILLATAQEWEDVAHRGVSIAVHLTEVSNLVIAWRKLELHHWKNLLQINFQREQREAKQWWFHLFASAIEYGSEDQRENGDKRKTLLKLLHQFMESSSIGQFVTRLSLLESLHRHFTGLLQTPFGDTSAKSAFVELTSLVWNALCFYRQFVASVNTRIKSLSAPIEQRIKDFIKISRWNDANFWALRDSVKKSQKTLSKLVSEYRKVLQTPVSTVLIADVSGILDSQFFEKKRSKLKAPKMLSYLMPLEWATMCSLSENVLQECPKRLSKLQKYYEKSRTISQEIMEKDQDYSSQITEVDELAGTVIERVHQLQNLEVPEEKGEKRKKALHHVHNLRRKSLAELFKALQDLHLSFRRGLIQLKNLAVETDFYDFSAEPADLSEGWRNLAGSSSKLNPDSELIDAWKDCESYFQKCISRIAVMLKSFQRPSKELGPNILDRCKGYVIDLLQHVTQEKDSIGKCGRLLWDLRQLLNIPEHREGSEMMPDALAKMLQEEMCELEAEYRQYILVADSLEEENYGEEKSALKRLCESVISQVVSIKLKLQESLGKLNVHGLSGNLVDGRLLRECLSLVQQILIIITNSQKKFTTSSVLWNSVERSKTKLSNWLQQFETSITSSRTLNEAVDSQEFAGVVEKTVEAVLLSFQRLDSYKSGQAKENEVEGEQFDFLMPLNRIESFDIEYIVKNVLKIRHLLSQSHGSDYIQRSSMLVAIIPLIMQFSFTLQFYLRCLTQRHRAMSKLLSVLSGVFATLGQKGFCLPSDYENDAVEESQELDEKSGMGLGEGETTSDAQDVSDRLESEDQLDETMKAGETAESADKDVGEDEKGIEMSEDFSGKQQDMEKNKEEDDKKNGDSSDEEQDMDDVEQEMGDVDAEGEKLDDKLWGGSSDEEDEPEEQNKEKGKGAQEKGETELASKDDKEESGEQEEDQSNEEGNNEPKNKEFNDNEDEEDPNDDQSDPYHGQNQPEEEPEAMDLPEDLQLDDAEAKDDKGPDENPFDLDAKDRELPEGFDEEQEKDEEVPEGEKPDEMSEDETAEGANEEINVEGAQLDQDEKESPQEADPSVDMDAAEADGEKEEEKEEERKVDASMEESNQAEEKAEPSAVPTQKTDDNSTSTADPESMKNKETVPVPTQEEENPSTSDEQAAGQVESKDGHGHEGKSVNKDMQESTERKQDSEDASRRPGQTDSKRSLADNEGNVKEKLKRLKTMDKPEQHLTDESLDPETGGDDDPQEKAAELYQYIEAAEKKDALTIDNATKDQMDKQKGIQTESSDKTENPKMDEQVEDEEMEIDETPELKSKEEKPKPDLISGLPESQKKKPRGSKSDDVIEQETGEVEGDLVQTAGAQRPADSFSHTNLEYLKEKSKMGTESAMEVIVADDVMVDDTPSGKEASALLEWHDLESRTISLSQELCEQLRLILEPTQAARLKGDYKTGKRLNMRKVIPYIASGFRKDKIWLRRTQQSKREYQILLALDDSASMLDNQSKQMAFSAVAVVARALTLLEAGKVAVGSFGEDFKLIHSFDEPFTDISGAKIVEKFTFAQQRTRIAQLLQHSISLFSRSKATSSSSFHPDVAQLLIIISDGRGIYNEGEQLTKESIMRAREQNIFTVFIIVDNPDNKNSILDIKQPIFGPDKSLEIVRYMDTFPFPFYMILRDIGALPSVLSDALRQWFELVTSSDR